MRMYSKEQEELMYYERDNDIFRLVRIRDSEGEPLYIVKAGDKPLLTSVDKDPAMTFFIHKCEKAEAN